MIWKSILISASLGFAALQTSPAASQGAQQFSSVQDIPQSGLRKSLERQAPAAVAEAIRQLNELSPPAADHNYLRADPGGKLYYADPAPPPAPKGNSERPDSPTAVIGISPASVWSLHSKPGASRTVYLNFRGENVTGKQWNASSGRAAHPMKPYSVDANLAAFSQTELNNIAEIWMGIAEDYAPFDIDVTTQRPAAFGPNVGHILITDRIDSNGFAIYPNLVGGVAYVNVWGRADFTTYQPALVFYPNLSTPKSIVEASSHELGHNLGLSHDGTASASYYSGHGTGYVSWSAIMGVGYYTNVSQWSKGEYPGANNTQDDIAIITGKLTARSDDHGQTNTTASALGISNTGVVSPYNTPVFLPLNPLYNVNRGVLSTAADVDMFAFNVPNAGVVDLTVTPVWRDSFIPVFLRSANPDIRATLLRDNGTPGGLLVVQNDPADNTLARVTANVTPGRYLLRVEGVGVGNLTTGYSDYGSLGQYFIMGRVPTPPLVTLSVSTPFASRGTVTGGGNFPVGSLRTVTATPSNPALRFYSWTKGGVVVSRSASYQFVLNATTSLVANFVAATTTSAISFNAATK